MHIEKYIGELAAAHRLMNHGGACELFHGHNWAVTVWVDADVNEHGIAVDFLDFEQLRKKLYDELDHAVWLNREDSLVKVLKDNQVEMKLLEVDGEPTAENMAILILDRLKKTFPQGHRHGVKVSESTGCTAEVAG